MIFHRIFSADSRYDSMAEETVQNYRVFLGSEFFGSEFSRHPEGLSFRDSQGVVSKTQTLRKLDNFERSLKPYYRILNLQRK